VSERRIGVRAEQKRRWDSDNKRPCPECGDRSIWRNRDRCRVCWLDAKRARRDELRSRIAEMWTDGVSVRDIAERLDATVGAINVELTRMRADGWDVPPRRAGWKWSAA
jgi:hypothetical protein